MTSASGLICPGPKVHTLPFLHLLHVLWVSAYSSSAAPSPKPQVLYRSVLFLQPHFLFSAKSCRVEDLSRPSSFYLAEDLFLLCPLCSLVAGSMMIHGEVCRFPAPIFLVALFLEAEVWQAGSQRLQKVLNYQLQLHPNRSTDKEVIQAGNFTFECYLEGPCIV